MRSIVTHTAAQPTVESLTDYYPFGMAMPGRSYNAYRYGFNSQENVPELGDGHTTALYWEYDGRLGRRWNGTVNREYSWHYFNHTFTVFNKGMAFDPNSENEASVPSLISHSHPSTDFSKCLSWDPALETLSVNTKMLFMRMVLLKINMYGVWVIELYTYMTQLV